MQIEEFNTNTGPSFGTPYYFSAVLFEGWEFWSPGPQGPIKQTLLIELAVMHNVTRAVIVKTYVPYPQ